MNIREKSTYYISLKQRTEQQVRDYLRNKGFDGELVEDEMDYLKEMNYVNDLTYSVDYYHFGYKKGYGPYYIKEKLVQRGVSGETIQQARDQALEEYPENFEKDLCFLQAEKWLQNHKPDDFSQEKLRRKLAYRGFDYDHISRVVEQLREEESWKNNG